MLYTYFAAQGDREEAMTAVDIDAELAGGVVKGVDRLGELARLESVLTGRSLDEIRSDPRHGWVVSEFDEGDCVVLSFTDPLTRALASIEPDVLGQTVSNAADAGGLLHTYEHKDELCSCEQEQLDPVGWEFGRQGALNIFACPNDVTQAFKLHID